MFFNRNQSGGVNWILVGLGNPGKQQIRMERFLILGFAIGNAKTIFEMVDGFFNIHTDLVGFFPFCRSSFYTWIGA